MTEGRTAGPKFRYRRAYAGPVRAVVFDWAGTTVDYGSRAPVAAFAEVFRRRESSSRRSRCAGRWGPPSATTSWTLTE